MATDLMSLLMSAPRRPSFGQRFARGLGAGAIEASRILSQSRNADTSGSSTPIRKQGSLIDEAIFGGDPFSQNSLGFDPRNMFTGARVGQFANERASPMFEGAQVGQFAGAGAGQNRNSAFFQSSGPRFGQFAE